MPANATGSPQPWQPSSIPSQVLTDVEIMAEGLSFPEGPIAMADGSVLLTEIDSARFTRVSADGDIDTIATCDGGPNGAAIGPDGAAYVCNNGGRFASGTYAGGWIERIDIQSGEIEILYTECDGRRLSGPNDIVFEPSGAFWFTDTGKFRGRERDVGSIYYVMPGANAPVEVLHPAETPNGIGLSPDGTKLYYAETSTARLRGRTITDAGQLDQAQANDPSTLVCGLPGAAYFDSLAVDEAGTVCIGTLLSGCVTAIAPDGSAVMQYLLPPGLEDRMVTNICFGGPDLGTAYLTLADTGRLVRCPWPSKGLRLAFEA